ncbi:endonuclease/exonuclease/phosphatase family protein [Vibrio ruber]|uniref:endonuclease/exonuclease/phosphatase family protein n=1 Tax=Vibrio ruber TaxID=184755 RepID=UPI002892DE65|nr:endonuclease/exonuclease/phosphatase family protein [Vibrio ruber]WNJ94539.1 endonuclease/exonuclease/phosphatase family protein [Vibrio ruber]
MKKRLGILLAVLLLLSALGATIVFQVPDSPQLMSLVPAKSSVPSFDGQCYQNSHIPAAIDAHGVLNVLVWNIYKENRSDWEPALSKYSRNKQLILLQESSFDSPLYQWLMQQNLSALQVHAFSVFNKSAGVMNIAGHPPISACAYTADEPLIRLPKSALVAYYQLSQPAQRLAVVNVHAINFSLGIEAFQQQLQQLTRTLTAHQGPILFAGDFNSWSDERIQLVNQMMASLSMQEVTFSDDQRKQFLSHPLDHVFYRGLVLNQARVVQTTASDHNPILVSFSLPK